MCWHRKRRGNNEKFFEDINKQCNYQSNEDFEINIVRKKYERMLEILMDTRAQQYTDSTQFSWDLGKNKVRAIGFYRYGDKIINISMDKIERMAQWLEEQPGQDITNEFYGTGIESIIYKIEQLKEKCKQSKLPLNLINKAYEGIKNTMFGKKSVSEIQEESTRV